MLKHYVSKRKKEITLATTLSSISAFISILLLAYLNKLAGEGLGDNYKQAILYGLALLALMFISNIISQTYLARFGTSTIAELRRDLSERFLAMDYQQLLKIGKSQVTGSLITDVTRVATLFLVLPMFFFNMMTVLFCLVYLLFLTWKLFAVFAVFMALAIFSSLLLMGKSSANFVTIRDEEDKLFEAFRSISEGKKELSLNRTRARHFLNTVIQGSIDKTWALGYQAQKWWNYGGTWSITMIFGALFSIIYIGHASFVMDQVLILQFVLVTLFLMSPLNYLIVASQDIAIGFSSVKKLEKLGMDDIKLVPFKNSTDTQSSWKILELSNIRYKYHTDDKHAFEFGPINFAIKKGETLFITGGNGSGKSTFAYLLTGLLQPDEGNIMLDGEIVTPQSLNTYQQMFSVIFFDFHLFQHVIDRQGKAADDNLISDFLLKLDLQDKVNAVNGKLSTTDLSQGQRKRLALLQSYVDNSEIFLFDEWAADQDPSFKQYFYYQLLPGLKKRGKTIVAITHDDKYFDAADRMICLEQGNIASHEHATTDTRHKKVETI